MLPNEEVWSRCGRRAAGAEIMGRDRRGRKGDSDVPFRIPSVTTLRVRAVLPTDLQPAARASARATRRSPAFWESLANAPLPFLSRHPVKKRNFRGSRSDSQCRYCGPVHRAHMLALTDIP